MFDIRGTSISLVHGARVCKKSDVSAAFLSVFFLQPLGEEHLSRLESDAYSKSTFWCFFKSACQEPRVWTGGGGGGGRGKREGEGGGAGDQETSQPIYLTAIYHSESMCQQLCLLHGRLPPPPCLPPSLSLPPSPVQSCIGALCVCT